MSTLCIMLHPRTLTCGPVPAALKKKEEKKRPADSPRTAVGFRLLRPALWKSVFSQCFLTPVLACFGKHVCVFESVSL